MNKYTFASILLFFIGIYSFAQYQPHANGELIKHTYYSLSYIEEHEQAEWVYYTILKGNTSRTDDFRPDPKVSTKSAALSDYKASGYDRGHLCPAAAMKINHTAMSETFYMSNMSPQKPYFNRGIWKNLEALVRQWGMNTKTHVVTGPIFKDNIGVIGGNNVTIPGYYYKVIYQPETNLMIGFILPNEKSSKPLDAFVTSVDSIESITGIDFFYQIEDDLEDVLEAKKGDIQSFSTEKKAVITPTNKSTNSTQCLGTAKSTGKRCKQKTTDPTGYCRYHKK